MDGLMLVIFLTGLLTLLFSFWGIYLLLSAVVMHFAPNSKAAAWLEKSWEIEKVDLNVKVGDCITKKVTQCQTINIRE